MASALRYTLFLAVGLAVGAWSGLAQSPGETGEGAPRIVADEDSHDFGKVDQGQKVSCTFTLRNEGDAPLHILSAKGS